MRELFGTTGFGVGGESLRAADKANSVKFISFINIPTAPANYIIYQNPNNTRLKIIILYIFYYLYLIIVYNHKISFYSSRRFNK